MNMKSGWVVVGDNYSRVISKEDYINYKNKMFKWGLALQKMKVNKPKFNKSKDYKNNFSTEEEEEK